MNRRLPILALVVTAALAASVEARVRVDSATTRPPAVVAEIDPIEFFDRLMVRYRALSEYEDLAMVRRVLERGDAPPLEQGSRIGCVIHDGEFDVITPGAQWWRQFGVEAPRFGGEAVNDQRRAYRLWLAPHMALSLSQPKDDAPKDDAPTDAEESPSIDSSDLAAQSVTTVTVGDRQMIHLELATPAEEGEEPATTLDLYVDPDRMLIERMESEQHFDSGETLRTLVTIEAKGIEPAMAEGAVAFPDDPPVAPVPVDEEPVTLPIDPVFPG